MNSLILSLLISSFLFYRHEFYDNITDSFLFFLKHQDFIMLSWLVWKNLTITEFIEINWSCLLGAGIPAM